MLLVRIAHADLAATLRYAEGAGDIASGGNTYLGNGLRLPLPSDDDGLVETTLELGIVDMDDDTLDTLLDASGDPPTVEVDVVLISAPSTVEATFYFDAKNAVADEGVLRMALAHEPVQARPYPGYVYDAARFPDLFTAAGAVP